MQGFKRICAGVLAMGAVSGGANAQDSAPGLSIGVVAASTQSAYIGRDTRNALAPALRYDGARFTLGSDGLGIKAIESERHKLSFHLAPRLSPLNSPSEPQLAGIDRDHGLDLAVAYEHRPSERFGLSARLSKGISAAQRGVELRLAARQAVALGPLPVILSAGGSWKSAELSQYYYGVGPAEVAVGRPAYTVGATTTPFVSVSSSVPLGDHARLYGTVKAEFLGSAITNSPIVVRSTVVSAALGVSYGF